jgi:hypothetical protein
VEEEGDGVEVGAKAKPPKVCHPPQKNYQNWRKNCSNSQSNQNMNSWKKIMKMSQFIRKKHLLKEMWERKEEGDADVAEEGAEVGKKLRKNRRTTLR